MNALTEKALLNPFLQAAFVFTLMGMAMIRKPAGAWTIALAGVTIYSIAAPLLMSLTRQWFHRLFLTNMSVIVYWTAILLLARILTPYPADSPPPFLLGGMVYVFSIALSAALRILFPIITRFIPGGTSAEPENSNVIIDKGGL